MISWLLVGRVFIVKLMRECYVVWMLHVYVVTAYYMVHETKFPIVGAVRVSIIGGRLLASRIVLCIHLGVCRLFYFPHCSVRTYVCSPSILTKFLYASYVTYKLNFCNCVLFFPAIFPDGGIVFFFYYLL